MQRPSITHWLVFRAPPFPLLAVALILMAASSDRAISWFDRNLSLDLSPIVVMDQGHLRVVSLLLMMSLQGLVLLERRVFGPPQHLNEATSPSLPDVVLFAVIGLIVSVSASIALNLPLLACLVLAALAPIFIALAGRQDRLLGFLFGKRTE